MGRLKPALSSWSTNRLSPPSAEEKRIYRLPVFTAPFCQALLQELEHFEQSDLPKGRPNTMNNYGVGETPAGGPGEAEVGTSVWSEVSPALQTLQALVSLSVKRDHGHIIMKLS